MDAESWTASGEYSRGVADNTPWSYQALNNTNDLSSQSGKGKTEGNYGETWDGDFENAYPPSPQGPVARMQGILPEVTSPSTSTHNGSMAFSPDCQTIPSGTTLDPIKYSKFSVLQQDNMENEKDDPEGYMERGDSVMSNMDNSVNDQLTAAPKQDLKRDNPFTWTSVIKEALEMTNGMELGQELLADVCGNPPIYNPPAESGAAEFLKNSFDPADNKSDDQEGSETIKAQETTVIILSDDAKRSHFEPSHDFQQRIVTQYRGPLTEESSLNDKVLDETSCRTLMIDISSLSQSKTAETDVLCFTRSPCLSEDMHEQCTNLNEQMPSVSLAASNSTGYENYTSVLRQAPQHSSHTTPKEHAHSCENVSTEKCMENQTKSCTGTLCKHLSKTGHHLKCNTISAEPSPICLSTSDSKHEDLVHNVVQKENPPPLTHNFMPYVQTSMGISKTWTESKEANLVPKKEESRSYTECTPGKPDVLTVFTEDSCKVVREKENVLEDMPTCGQSHFSCELSSSDTNNTSLMISNIDMETRDGRIIASNVTKVGSVSNDTSAHYNSKVQSQSLIINSSPETGVTDVLVLENTSEDRKSEVNFRSLQTSTDLFEKETTQLEPCKDHTTHQTQHECKIGLDCKSSCLLSNASPLAKMKKRVWRTFRKKKILKDVQDTRKNSRRLKRKTKTEKMRSRLTNIRKSHRTAITVRKEKKLLQNHHAKIKENRRFRKKRKVKRPALVSDSGQNQCMNTSKMSTNHTGQVFKTSSGSQPNIFQKGSSKARRLLKCFEEPLKTESHLENLDDMMSQSEHAKDFRSNASNKLLKMASDSQNSTNVKGSRKQALWDKSSKEKPEITELNGDAGLELSLQSTVKTTGFHSCHTNAFYTEVEDKKSRNLLKDVNVKVPDKHQEERSERDVGGTLSAVQNVDRFTQYCDEDCVTTHNKDVCKVPDAVKSTKLAKKLIKCKYCSLSFRHISAYTVHQRIHTGHKPYRCDLCSKSFAQLSKLKSHRCVHVHSVSLPCPCCGKKFSEKKDLIAHFTTHLKDTKRNKESDQQDKTSKSDAPCSRSKTCNISSNKFPAGYMHKIHEHDQDNPVSCKNCGKEFSTSSKLAVHEKTHWPVKPYACSICAKGFTQINALKKHSRMHTGETPFSCSHCHLAFFDLPALRVHQLSKLCNRKQSCDLEGFLVSHGVDREVNTPTFFKCQICRQLYQKWCQYTLHLQTHTKSSSYLCFACGQSYENVSEVSVHCRVCCQKSGEEVACGSSLSEILHRDPRNCTNLKEGSPTGMYSVEASKSNSPSSADLYKNSQTLNNLHTEHIGPESSQLVKTSDLPETETVHLFDDDRVPASPTSTLMSCASLNESLECVETSPSLWRFKCPHCGQRYKRYRTLRLHMQTHAPAFRYVCSHCGRTFKKWNNLWLHQRIHRRKGRRYSCPQCNVQFHIFSAYKMHLLNHAKERPYACPLCPQAFSHEEALHVHQCTSLHQPARKLKCDVCARSFSSSTNLVKHGLLHNGATSHRCLLCVSSFTNNERPQDHLNVHDNTASLLPSIPSEPITFLHKCNRCKSSFSTGDLLYAHQLCHTGDLKRQVRPNQSSKSTSVSLKGARASTSISLQSSFNLDAIPKETLFKYPHPDKLYIPPHLSRRSKNLRIIHQDSMDEDLEQESISNPVTPNSIAGPSGQNIPQEYSETAMSDQSQSLESQESVQSRNIDKIPVLHIDPVSEKFIHSVPPQTAEFFETSVILEEPRTTTTTMNPAENERPDEIFECADCSEKLHSLIGLYEHYFLHAVGNTNLYRFL